MNSVRIRIVLFSILLILYFLIYFAYLLYFEGNIFKSIEDRYVRSVFHASRYLIDRDNNIKLASKMLVSLNEELRLDIIHIFIFNKKQNILVKPVEKYNVFSSCKIVNKINNKSCVDIFIEDADKNKVKNIEMLYANSEVLIKEQQARVYTIYHDKIDSYISILWPVSDINSAVKKFIITPLLAIFVIFLVVSFLFFYYLISRTIKPLEILSQQMLKLPDYDFVHGDTIELKQFLPVSVNNEIGGLARTFSSVIDRLNINIVKLLDETAKNERMEGELKVAREIQLGSLPKNFSFAEEKGVRLYAHLIPAREVGGDLYDFFFIDDDHVCIAVGDVADKGVPASLFMIVVKKIIGSKANDSSGTLSPAEIMNQINEMMCKGNQSATFITLFIGILNVKNGELRYANGGHVPPVFTNGITAPFFKKELSGPVVGVIPGLKYKEITVALQHNWAVFICTDGITEAMNEDEQLFGEKRLLESFASMQGSSCKEVIDGILREVKIHAGKAPQSDDIAAMMLRWKGTAM